MHFREFVRRQVQLMQTISNNVSLGRLCFPEDETHCSDLAQCDMEAVVKRDTVLRNLQIELHRTFCKTNDSDACIDSWVPSIHTSPSPVMVRQLDQDAIARNFLAVHGAFSHNLKKSVEHFCENIGKKPLRKLIVECLPPTLYMCGFLVPKLTHKNGILLFEPIDISKDKVCKVRSFFHKRLQKLMCQLLQLMPWWDQPSIDQPPLKHSQYHPAVFLLLWRLDIPSRRLCISEQNHTVVPYPFMRQKRAGRSHLSKHKTTVANHHVCSTKPSVLEFQQCLLDFINSYPETQLQFLESLHYFATTHPKVVMLLIALLVLLLIAGVSNFANSWCSLISKANATVLASVSGLISKANSTGPATGIDTPIMQNCVCGVSGLISKANSTGPATGIDTGIELV